MAIIKSAKKRIRQAKKRNISNRILSSKLKKIVKDLNKAIQSKNKKKSIELFKIAQKTIVKCSKKGILHKKNAAKKVSILNSKIKTLK